MLLFFYCNLLKVWRLGVSSAGVENWFSVLSPGFKNVGNRTAGSFSA